MVPLNLKWKLPFSHFGSLMLVNQWTKKNAIVLAVVNNSNYPGEMELLPNNWVKAGHVCNGDDCLEGCSVLLQQVLKGNGKPQLHPGRTAN